MPLLLCKKGLRKQYFLDSFTRPQLGGYIAYNISIFNFQGSSFFLWLDRFYLYRNSIIYLSYSLLNSFLSLTIVCTVVGLNISVFKLNQAIFQFKNYIPFFNTLYFIQVYSSLLLSLCQDLSTKKQLENIMRSKAVSSINYIININLSPLFFKHLYSFLNSLRSYSNL